MNDPTNLDNLTLNWSNPGDFIMWQNQRVQVLLSKYAKPTAYSAYKVQILMYSDLAINKASN